MTDRKREIEFLERLYYGAEVTTMHHDFELTRAAERALTDLAKIAERAGKSGAWCFSCGASGVSLDHCGCGLAESFGCAGQLFCSDCRAGRRTIAHHIQKLLAAKKTDRVSSIRLRLLREIRRAARDIEGEDSNPADSRLLSYWLANSDEFSDDGDGFRAGVLRGFQRTRFLNFAALATALERQRDESLIRSLIRAGLR